MTPQFIKTEGDDELVVLARRAYDALLARLGDGASEDCATARMVDDYLAEKATGHGAAIPHWFAVAVAEHGSSVKAARRHFGSSRRETAGNLGIAPAYLAEVERGRVELSDEQRGVLARCTGIEAD